MLTSFLVQIENTFTGKKPQKNVLKKKGDNVEFDGVKETHAHAAI